MAIISKSKNKLLMLMLMLMLLSFFVLSCSKNDPIIDFPFDYVENNIDMSLFTQKNYPEVSFASFSDSHFYSTTLGDSGEAFDNYLANDRKLLAQSEEILQVAIQKIISTDVEFVIVSGDLTKDGEKINHEIMAYYLEMIENSGKSVYVVPGNHDLINPNAVSFVESDEVPVEWIDQDYFESNYYNYGFDEAIARDENSLSYVAEPVEDLWLFCLDSTITENNIEDDYPETDGRFSDLTLKWIEKMLIDANQQNKAIIVTLHHGIVPHWEGQEKLHNEYLIEGYESIQQLFANYNARLVFTGHYHSQDIAKSTLENEKFVFDIETGSLVTYPCPYRIMSINSNQELTITSDYVDNIPSIDENYTDFIKEFVYDGIYGIALNVIQGFKVPENQAELIAPQVAEAYLAHYYGDENSGNRLIFDQTGLGLMGKIVMNNQKYVLYGLWNDSECADNHLKIDLRSGEWVNLSE